MIHIHITARNIMGVRQTSEVRSRLDGDDDEDLEDNCVFLYK